MPAYVLVSTDDPSETSPAADMSGASTKAQLMIAEVYSILEYGDDLDPLKVTGRYTPVVRWQRTPE